MTHDLLMTMPDVEPAAEAFGEDVFAHILRSRKTWFTTNEVADMIGQSRQFVSENADGHFEMHVQPTPATGAMNNLVKRIHRRSVIAYLYKTCRYKDRLHEATYRSLFAELLPLVNPETLRNVALGASHLYQERVKRRAERQAARMKDEGERMKL